MSRRVQSGIRYLVSFVLLKWLSARRDLRLKGGGELELGVRLPHLSATTTTMLRVKPPAGKLQNGERRGKLIINCLRVNTRSGVQYYHYDGEPGIYLCGTRI